LTYDIDTQQVFIVNCRATCSRTVHQAKFSSLSIIVFTKEIVDDAENYTAIRRFRGS